MKKYVFILALFLSSGLATSLAAQVVVDGVNINNLEEVSMVRVIVQNRFLSTKVNVFIDYGQSLGGAQRQRMEVVNPRTNERIKFNSVMHAINFMIDNGWVYVESMVLPAEGNTSSNSVQYLFKRK